MKRIIKYIIFFAIVIYGAVLLTMNWPVYKDFIYHDIVEKIIKSDFERSLEHNNKRIKNEPNNPWSYIDRGATYKENKKYKEALQDYSKAYELNNSFFSVFSNLSNIYLAMGNTEKAYDNIYMMMKKAPYPESSLFDLAIIYDYEWKSKDAIDTYTKFIKLNNMEKVRGKYIFSLKRRAFHYSLLKEYDKAKDDIEILFKKNPSDKDVKKLQDLLSGKKDLNDSVIHEKFKIDVHEAIVGTTEI
jgi:tetratricopeptide (TPR) repeat protein